MKLIKEKIQDLNNDISELKEQQKKSYDSIKNVMDGGYYNSTKEKYEQVLCLIFNVEFDPYRNRTFNISGIDHISQCSYWVKGDSKTQGGFVYEDYCNIYPHEYGSPFGIITKKETLFISTERYHKELWRKVVEKNSKEERSFKEFQKSLKNPKVLFELLTRYLNYDITIYQDKSLKIEPHYLILQYNLEHEY